MRTFEKIVIYFFISVCFFLPFLYAESGDVSIDKDLDNLAKAADKITPVIEEIAEKVKPVVEDMLEKVTEVNDSEEEENFAKKYEDENFKLYIIPIEGTIEPGLAGFVERSLKEAESVGITHLIFKIDTLGGRVDSATKVKDLIVNSVIKNKIAYIDKKAISAGAFIALAAKQIVMAPGAVIGAAKPVTIAFGGSGMQPTDEKTVSYLRKEFKAVAEINGYPTDIAEAFVDQDVEIAGVSEKGKLLTLTTEEALKYNLASMKVESMDKLITALELESATRGEAKYNWSEKLTRILTHPMLTSILMTIGLLGIIVEIKTPGFGFPGIVGIGAILIFFFAQHLVGLANHLEMLIFIAGVVLLGLEIFVIPGFGFCGILGITAIVTSLFMSLLKQPMPEIPIAREQYLTVFYILLRSFVMTGIITYLLYKFILPRVPAFSPIILKKVENHTDGFVATVNYESLVGQTGKAVSALRPSGKAMFAEKLMDVVTESEFIDKDAEIVVLRVEGMKVIVARKK